MSDVGSANGAGAQPAPRKRRGGQPGSRVVLGNFARMEQVFGTGVPGTAVAAHPGSGLHDGALPPVSDVKPLVEVDVLGKVALLTFLAICAGAVSFVLPVSLGLAFVCVFVAFGIGIWTCFRPHIARVSARVYAVVEGVALGVISRYFNADSHGIVPMAIVLTGALIIGVLIAYRTGLVRISNRFISTTVVASFALLAVMVAVLLGLSVPGFGSNGTTLVVFGVIYVVVAIMDLFVDFELIRRAAQAGVPAEAEWFAAFSVFLAVVMLYLGLLRILGGGRR